MGISRTIFEIFVTGLAHPVQSASSLD
jgi:hypothetical protein